MEEKLTGKTYYEAKEYMEKIMEGNTSQVTFPLMRYTLQNGKQVTLFFVLSEKDQLNI